jgi:hypothetical protein
MKMTYDPDAIAEKILALRQLTAETGTATTRTQNDILRSLPDDVLAEVAVRLKRSATLLAALSAGR